MRKIKTRVKQRWLSRYFRICVKDEKKYKAIVFKQLPRRNYSFCLNFWNKYLEIINKYKLNQFIDTIEHKALVKVWKLKREVKKIDFK